jgi:hypothetical protein
MSERCFVAAFESEDDVKAAVRSARHHGYLVQDVYTPYAVHGLDEVMGLRPSRLSWACLAFAILGASTGLWLQHWTSTTDWPLNVGGKPFNSLPAFVPVTFELAVLLAGLGTVAALFVRSRLFPGKTVVLPESRVTDDRFLMVIAEKDASFDSSRAAGMCEAHHAVWCGEWIDGHVYRFARDETREARAADIDEPRSEPERHISQRGPRLRKRSSVPVASE